MSFKIVTICNKVPLEPYYCLFQWKKSLQGIEPLVLGWHPNEYGGLGSKPRLLYWAIKNGAIKEKYIIFSDCFDLVFSSHPSNLFAKYKEFNSPFVISTERNSFPDTYTKQYDEISPVGKKYKYINSGMIVAETEAMLTILEAMGAENIPNDYWDEEKQQRINPNDQEYYQKIFLEQPVKMVMDYNQELSGTLHETKPEELDFSEEKIRRVDTNTYPLSWHMNGNGKTSGCREAILKHLNLL
jgi:hypothetical protein